MVQQIEPLTIQIVAPELHVVFAPEKLVNAYASVRLSETNDVGPEVQFQS